MKLKFTHKELTLLLGILVAVIIMVTLWMKPFSHESGDVSEKPAHSSSNPGAIIMIGKTYVLVKELLK